MGQVLSIKQVGDSAIMDIIDVHDIPNQNDPTKPQVCFTGSDGDMVIMPKESAVRNLTRIKLDLSGIIGERLKIYRAENPTPGRHPFWNIDRMEKGAARPVPTMAIPNTSSPGYSQTGGAHAPVTQSAPPPTRIVEPKEGTLQQMFGVKVPTLATMVPFYLAAGASLDVAITLAAKDANCQFIEMNKTNRELGESVPQATQQIGSEYVRRAIAGMPRETVVPNVKPPVVSLVRPEIPDLLRDDVPKEMPKGPAWMQE